MEKISLYLSTVATVFLFTWAAVAQALHYDFKMDETMKTVILAPYMRVLYRTLRRKIVGTVGKETSAIETSDDE